MVDLTVNLIINIKGQHKGIKTVPAVTKMHR